MERLETKWAAVLGRKLEANAAAMERLRRARRLLMAALGCGCSDLAICARRDAHP